MSRNIRLAVYVILFLATLAIAGLGGGARYAQADGDARVFLPLVSRPASGTLPDVSQ